MESMTVTVPEIQTELSLARRRIAELEAQLAAAASADTASTSFEAMRLREVEGQLRRRAMQLTRVNVSRAARALGLSRSALYRRLERHGLTTSGEPIRSA